MRTLRRNSGTPSLAAALACAITLMTTQTVPVAATSANANQAVYSGQALVDGLFFGYGPVASRLPEIFGDLKFPTHIADDGFSLVRDKVYGHISETNPQFFDEFSSAMQSGDHVLIAASLDHAADVVYDSYTATYPRALAGASRSSSPQGWFLVVVLIVTTAVLVTTATAVTTTTAVHVAVAVTTSVYRDTNVTREEEQETFEAEHSGFNNEGSDLKFDYLVSLIADRFATA